LNGEAAASGQNTTHSTATGLSLALFGGMVLSFDIPLIRLADGDALSVMFTRSVGVGIAVLLIIGAARFFKWDGLRFDFGRPALMASAAYALTSVTFITSVHLTSTANVVFILAFTGMFAAILGWLFNGEKPAGPTLAAMLATVGGVALIVSDGLDTGRWAGDALALLTALLLAFAITHTRKHQMDLRLNVLAANCLMAAVSAPFLIAAGNGLTINAPHWALLNGLVVIPLSFMCLAYAPRLLYGPVVAMAYLLETIFAPVWVWLILSETPTRMTLVGGAIILAAIIAHAMWELRLARPRTA
jgi:drug/metabolite transporter (DMT)-like permease